MTFFDLERPEHAYMFAFLQADGHLTQESRNRGRLTVELSARDAPILERFQQLCPHNSTISYRTRTTNFKAEHTSATWTVYAREFREELQALGLPAGRKSEVVAPPSAPFSERDYLRGLIDADGSVGRTAQDLPFVSLTTQSDAIASFFISYAEELSGAERRIFHRNSRDGIYNVMYAREEAVVIANNLYYTRCLSLPRKQSGATRAGTWCRPADMKRVIRRSWTPEEDTILLRSPTLADAAKNLKRSTSSCQVRRWRLLNLTEDERKARGQFPAP
ncbi:LAGLIDADG family homing endonuclease [Kitasatospora sp. NPDC048296]|uniref:LAGLIDADG family homing endonuclease n=1 Tax=Kitasatospora sp. NPDC048296 TaxID=3364048 RepID=UPI003724624A